MIKFIPEGGDILESQCDAIVNPVNCKGIAGKGLAKSIKDKYPSWFVYYKNSCKAGNIKVGHVSFYFLQEDFFGKPNYIINFPTKDDWQNPSKIEYIEEGLTDLIFQLCHGYEHLIKSIAVPALGCGLGNLKYGEVKPLIDRAANQLPNILWEIYSVV